MKHRRLFCVVLLAVFGTGGSLLYALSPQSLKSSEGQRGRPNTYKYAVQIRGDSFVEGVQSGKADSNAKCLQSKNEVCTVCGVEGAISMTVNNKTRTPLFACRGMKPGPAKLVMETHAEPASPGLWEVEFGLGYHTAAREECPHQFIASNNPPMKAVYEIGPISIDGEIPANGNIQALVCVGLSSARTSGEGKETGASLRISSLKIVSQ